MPKAARTKKMQSVTTTTASVAAACMAGDPVPPLACCYASSQSQVWEDVAYLQEESKVASSTSAMSDVYEATREKVDHFTDQFELLPGQKGILVMKNGEIMGMDLLSQPDAYEELHRKIVGSYVIESAIEEAGLPEENSDEAAQAEAFLGELSLAEGEAHKSAGEGTDVRYDAPTLSGTALMHDEQLIHASFLRHDPQLPPASVTVPYPML